MANPSGALMLKTLQSWAAPVISWFMLVYNHNKTIVLSCYIMLDMFYNEISPRNPTLHQVICVNLAILGAFTLYFHQSPNFVSSAFHNSAQPRAHYGTMKLACGAFRKVFGVVSRIHQIISDTSGWGLVTRATSWNMSVLRGIIIPLSREKPSPLPGDFWAGQNPLSVSLKLPMFLLHANGPLEEITWNPLVIYNRYENPQFPTENYLHMVAFWYLCCCTGGIWRVKNDSEMILSQYVSTQPWNILNETLANQVWYGLVRSSRSSSSSKWYWISSHHLWIFPHLKLR